MNRTENEKPYSISTGAWDGNISWEFFVANEFPSLDLCTAVCCVVTFENKIFIVRNKRGWELPAGHIETGETPEEAIQREVFEETKSKIPNPRFFGYKKLTTTEKVTKRGQENEFYPFPYSYVIFYYAKAEEKFKLSPEQDVEEVRLVTLFEAPKLLDIEGKYKNIFEYLLENGFLTLGG